MITIQSKQHPNLSIQSDDLNKPIYICNTETAEKIGITRIDIKEVFKLPMPYNEIELNNSIQLNMMMNQEKDSLFGIISTKSPFKKMWDIKVDACKNEANIPINTILPL